MKNWRQILSYKSKPRGQFWNFNDMEDDEVIKTWNDLTMEVDMEDELGIVDAYSLKMVHGLEIEMSVRGIKSDDPRLRSRWE